MKSKGKNVQQSEATIHVSSLKGPCVTDTQPDSMVAPRGGAVVWKIRNDCAHEHEVGIRFLAGDPLKPDPRTKTVPAGQMRALPCNVKGEADEGKYPYAVDLDAEMAADPELEVRGPLAPKYKKPR